MYIWSATDKHSTSRSRKSCTDKDGGGSAELKASEKDNRKWMTKTAATFECEGKFT